MHEQALRVYLDEHLVGARTVTHLVERRIDDGVGPGWLQTFREDLEEEMQVVEGIAERLDASGVAPARLAGQTAQAAARGALRLTEMLLESLRDLLEFEAMFIGVQGKACLWRSLRLFEDHPVLAGVDLDRLEELAAEHGERLEEFRLQAAAALREQAPPTG